jgi:hypothetical protein
VIRSGSLLPASASQRCLKSSRALNGPLDPTAVQTAILSRASEIWGRTRHRRLKQYDARAARDAWLKERAANTVTQAAFAAGADANGSRACDGSIVI